MVSIFLVSTPFLLFLIGYMITHPEKVEIWSSLTYRLFAWVNSKMECRYIASDIQGKVNLFSKSLSKDAENLIPYGLKIEWVKETEKEAFLKDGQIIVRMQHHGNQDKNFVNAIMAYVPKAVVPQARTYLHETISKSIDFTIMKKILMSQQGNSALDYFNSSIFTPESKRDDLLRYYCSKMERLDERGMFTRMLLQEFLSLARKVYPKYPNDQIFEETSNFTDFLENIAGKEPGEDVPLQFEGKYINAAIIIVAKSDVISYAGIEPYINRINAVIKQNTENIYISAWGTHNVADTEEVVKQFSKNENIHITSKKYKLPVYKGRRVPAICIIFRSQCQ